MKINKFTLILAVCLTGCMMAFTACGGSDKDKTSDADIDDKDYYGEEVTFENTQEQDVIKVDSAALCAIIGPDRALESLHGNVRMVVTDNNSWSPDTAIFDTDGYYTYKTIDSSPVDFTQYPKTGKTSLRDTHDDYVVTLTINRDDNEYLCMVHHEYEPGSDAEYYAEYFYYMTVQWVDGKVLKKEESRMAGSSTTVYTYNDNGDVVSAVEDGDSEGTPWTRQYKYTPIITDEFGNWIERRVDLTVTYFDEYDGSPAQTETTASIEKRQITYY